jgi:hypothetical protein
MRRDINFFNPFEMKKILYFLLPLSLFLTLCKPKDPCEKIVCQNGGACLNGSCSCPTGYEGPACEKEKTPKAMYITGVKLLNFPGTKSNGAGWDVLPSSGPDLYFAVSNKTTSTLIRGYPGSFYPDATAGILPLTFTVATPIKMSDMSSQYEVDLYDADSVTDEFMGGIYFTPYVSGQKFPTKIALSCSGCNTSWELTVIYEY